MRIGEIMQAPVRTIRADEAAAAVREAANLLRGNHINCLPVFEGTRLMGLVTTLDILDLVGRGADRPVATAERRTLKDRGQKLRQTQAKRLARAKVQAT